MRSLLAVLNCFPGIHLLSEVLKSNVRLNQAAGCFARSSVFGGNPDQVLLPLIADRYISEVNGSHC